MIVESHFTEGPMQLCGRRYVTEAHTDHAGQVHRFEWLGAQPAQAVADDRAAMLNQPDIEE